MHSRHFMRARQVALDSLPARFGEFTVREYQPGDEHEILAAFNRIFAGVDPTFRPRSLANWTWRFRDNPSGARILLACTDDGRVAGQLAVVQQRGWLEGRPTMFGQAVDQMVDPSFQRGLRRTNLLGLLNNTFRRHFSGRGPEQHTFGFGVPVPAAWRSGKAFARYEVVRTLQRLWVLAEELRAEPRGVDLELEEVAAFPEDVGAFFARQAPRHGAIAVRDKAQLDWRWTRHREKRCRIGLVRRRGELVGYAVLTRGDFDGRTNLGVVGDWLVAPEEPQAGVLLRAWLKEAAAVAGIAQLEALFPDHVREWSEFQEAGFRVAPTSYFLTSKTYFRGLDARWLERHWYYTLGDTDLV
jgi:hypothetical protein